MLNRVPASAAPAGALPATTACDHQRPGRATGDKLLVTISDHVALAQHLGLSMKADLGTAAAPAVLAVPKRTQ